MTEREAQIAELNAEVRVCRKCRLAETRTNAVPGEGPDAPELLFIGEGPGFHEDRQGRPFVGPSGQFLGELINSIGKTREQVYITNVVKCRPPANRDPAPDEIAACAPYLDRQLALLQPKIAVTLGRYSMARYFPGQSISRVHGQARRMGNLIAFPMFHPAAALHRQELAGTLREDILKIPALLDELTDRPPEQVSASEAGSEPDDEPQQLSLF